MPRKSAGARLYLHPERQIYYIRDRVKFIATGTRNRREAETALARYIADRDGPTGGPRTPDKMTVADCLVIYSEKHAANTVAPDRIAYAIKALVPILGSLPVGSITGEVCRRYASTRNRSPGTVRRELGMLRAAINYCHAEGYLTVAPRVRLPGKPPSRDRWLARDEAAKLLRAARRLTKGKHLARYILVALYTGTRSSAVLGLSFMPHVNGGWVDTERGVMYRRTSGEVETKKRTPPVRIPRRLLAHLRRWERMGARFVVEDHGQRVGSVKTAWRAALAASGIEHCRPHDLRHTCATWMMQAGANKWDAAGFLGMGLDMLERTYGHHHPDHMRSAVEALDRRA